MIKLNISHYYRKILEKSRSFWAYLSASKRIDPALFVVSARERFAEIGASRFWRKLASALPAARKPRRASGSKAGAERKKTLLARLSSRRKSILADPLARKRPSAKRKPFLADLSAGGKSLFARLSAFRERRQPAPRKPLFARLSASRERRLARRKSLLASANKARRSAEKTPFRERLSAKRKSLFARLSVPKPRPQERKRPRPAGEKPALARPPAGRRLDALLAAATLLVLTFVVSGYVRGITAAPPTPTGIFVSPQYWAMFGDAAHTFVAEFEEQHPGFRIVMAEHEEPDVVFFDDGDFAFLVQTGALASLSPYVYTETEEDRWALPLVAFVDLFFYNIDILQEAGNDRPPRTRAEFLNVARSVAQTAAESREEIFPFALGLSEADPLGVRRDFHPWVWATGAEVHSGFTEDGALTLTTPAINAINFLADMNREGLLAPGSFEKTGRERLEQFAEGRIAMLVASARDMLFVREGARGINFDVKAIPAAALGRDRLGISGIHAGISSSSTRPEEAWGFLVFIAAQTHSLAAAIGAVPGSFFASFPGDHIEEDPLHSKAWEIFEAADIVEFPSDDFSEQEAGRIIRERLAQAFEAE